jgi:hypothetical protein
VSFAARFWQLAKSLNGISVLRGKWLNLSVSWYGVAVIVAASISTFFK